MQSFTLHPLVPPLSFFHVAARAANSSFLAMYRCVLLLQEQFVVVEDPKLHLTSTSYHVVVQQLGLIALTRHTVLLEQQQQEA